MGMYAKPVNAGNHEGRERTDIDAHYLVPFIYLEGQRDLKRKNMITTAKSVGPCNLQ